MWDQPGINTIKRLSETNLSCDWFLFLNNLWVFSLEFPFLPFCLWSYDCLGWPHRTSFRYIVFFSSQFWNTLWLLWFTSLSKGNWHSPLTLALTWQPLTACWNQAEPPMPVSAYNLSPVKASSQSLRLIQQYQPPKIEVPVIWWTSG